MTQPQTEYISQPPADYLSTAGPYNYEQPLPPVARTNAVTQVPPAKKITFYKSGDPQFGGVKMAINQRSFKSFNALMDDLSHRVPLPFGVRTVTTPRGIHCISTLDQLEDGGCYLCSDKKFVTPISVGAPSRRAGLPRNNHPATSALRRVAQDVKREDYATAFAQQSPRIPKKITLVKNGDISTRRPIILNRRNARSFKTLLDEISEIMQFTVKKLYTVDGNRIDSMQALLHCPAVLVCVGREPFKPFMTESSRKASSEKLPGLASRSNSNNVGENSEMNFGLKAKKSVMHPRSSLSNRSTRFSLSSEKSFPNGLTTSPDNGAPSSTNCPHSKVGDLVHTLVNDDIEKKVHVNKDGSLSVEMKVRFRLLNDETLQWSTHIKKSSMKNQLPCEELGMDEDTGLDPIEKMNPEASSEADDSLYPCDADSYISKLDESDIEETHCHNCGKPHKDYDIWKNPVHASQKEEPGIRNTWYTHSSSSTSSQQKIIRQKITSFTDSIRTSSSGEEYSERIVRKSSSYSETVKNRLEGQAVKKCCCQCEGTRPNTSRRGSPEEPEAAACLASTRNEDDAATGDSVVRGEDGEGKGRKARRGKSKASQCSIESQTKIHNKTTAARRISSCSVKKTEDLEDVASHVSTPNSIHSKSSKCSKPGAEDVQEETSENEQVISSFSGKSCPKKKATEDESEKVEEDISGTYENVASNQSAKDETNECGRCSTGKSFYPKTCEGLRSDSDEKQMCSVTSSSTRISKKSKHSQQHAEADSEASSKRSSTASKKKKSERCLHAEDISSNSRASHCSRNSHELDKTATEGHGSHDSNPHLSEVAAPSATNRDISKCHSKPSRNSKKGSQLEAASKTSSPRSSFSDSNEKNRDGPAKTSSQLPSSRTGSMSESVCTKCGHVAIARKDYHQSVNSRKSSHSGTKTNCTEAERSEDACSQSSVVQASKPGQKKMNSLQADAENSSRASGSESVSMFSLHCPVPPKGRPSNRKRRTMVVRKASKSASVCTESEPAADGEQKISSFSRLASSVSKSLETDTANMEGNTSDIPKEEKGSCQEDPETALNEDGGIIPSSLPNATPEEVVHEWLRNIPSETLLMKYEMDDDGNEGTNLSEEIPECSHHQEHLGAAEMKEDTEDFENMPTTEAAGVGAEAQAEEATRDPNEEKTSEGMSGRSEAGLAECRHSAIASQNNPPKDLPSSIQTSVQIMKALLASKQETKLDRSHSLPEVSPAMGRKLSNSAKVMITCLASLQLLDEELDPPDKSKPSSRPRYMELLNVFQAFWFGRPPEKDGPRTEQPGEEQEKVALGIKNRCSKRGEFTATSSSGVDVSSHDGGSREGSVTGAQDCALSAEKIKEGKHTEEEEYEEENDEVYHKSFQEEEEVEGDEERPSRPSTALSKSERGNKAESSRVEEAAEAHDDQCSECEAGQDAEKENIRGEEEKEEDNSKLEDKNEEGAETDAEAHPTQELLEEEPEVDNSPNKEKIDGTTEQSNNVETDTDPNVNEANNERVQESNEEKLLADETPADMEPSDRVLRQATVTTSPAIHERSMDPDPAWVLKLLKKIEKAFMTHYVSAMNEFKVKWNLQHNEELDGMIEELKEEVSKRIQKSIEKELKKIRSRAGKRVPRPPNGELRRESTLQAESRRRRLQSIHKMSLLNGSENKQPETRDLSRDLDEMDFLFSTTINDDVSDLISDDEYCPCDVCLRKKISSKPTLKNVVVRSSAPVVKAFDLQQILQTQKGSDGEKKEADISEEIQDEKEVLTEPAEEEPDELKESPAIEPSEESKQDETDEQEEQEVNEDGTETLTNKEEAEEEEASSGVAEKETQTEEEAKSEQEQEEELKEDGAEEEEEEAEGNVKEEEQKKEEEHMKEEGKEDEEEKEEEEVDIQEGEEGDVKEEEEEEEKQEGKEGENVKEEVEEEEEKEEQDVEEMGEEKVEAEEEEVRSGVAEKETQTEGEEKSEQQEEEELKEDGAEVEEEEAEGNGKEQEQKEEEENMKEEGKEDEEEKEEEEVDIQEGEEGDVKEEEEEKQEGKEGENVKEEVEEEEEKEEQDVEEMGEEKVEAEEEEVRSGVAEKETQTEEEEKSEQEEEELKEDGAEEGEGEAEGNGKEQEQKEEEENMKEEGKEDEEEKDVEETGEEKVEGEDLKEEGEEKEEEKVKVEGQEREEREDTIVEEEEKDEEWEEGTEDEMKDEEERKVEEEIKDDEEEGENMKEKGDEKEEDKDEMEGKNEEENEKDEQHEKEREGEMEEEEKGEEDMEHEEGEKEEEEEKGVKEEEVKEEEEVEKENEEVIKEEEGEKEEKEEEEEEEENETEEVDEIEEEIEEESGMDVEEAGGENEDKKDEEEILEHVKGEIEEEEEEKEMEEVQDEKKEDVKEEDETKEEEEDKMEEEVEVAKEEEEEMKEEDKEEETEEEEVVLEDEEDNQEAKSEGDKENKEDKEMDEEQEKEDSHMEAEEPEPEDEDETDGAIEESKVAEGDNQENKSDPAENIADAVAVKDSERESAEEDNDIEEEAETSSQQETKEETGPDTGCEVCTEAAEVEEDGDDAGRDEEQAEEESHEPLQNDEDEKPQKGEDEEASEGLEPPRCASASSNRSSISNCSQQSQKGSEDGEDCNEEETVNNNGVDEDAQTDTKNKSDKMYPDSVEEEEEQEEEQEDRAFSQESAMKDRKTENSKNKAGGGQTSVKPGNSSEAIDQDDLDF